MTSLKSGTGAVIGNVAILRSRGTSTRPTPRLYTRALNMTSSYEAVAINEHRRSDGILLGGGRHAQRAVERFGRVRSPCQGPLVMMT